MYMLVLINMYLISWIINTYIGHRWIKLWRGDLKNRGFWGRGDTKIKVVKEEVTGKGDKNKMKSWLKKFSFKALAFAS